MRNNLRCDRPFGGRFARLFSLPAALLPLCVVSCSPRIEVVPPDKPITINMNIKIDHEVKVKVDRDLDEVISKDSELF